MTIAAYQAHTCPNDTNYPLVPCSYTHDMYECPKCKQQFVGEALTMAASPRENGKHFNG